MPAVALRHLLATALLGDHEGVESVMLSDVFSSGGARNTFIDRYGRTGQILGYLRQNASPITTNSGAAATRLRGLYHYADSTGGPTVRQEIGIFDDAAGHWEFRTSVDIGVTWTFKHDYGAGSINTIPDFAQSGNLMTMTNGVIAPAQWDGTNLTVAGSTQLAAPTFTSTGAGNLGPGNIGWRILPMVGNVRKLSSVQSINYSIIASTATGHVDWVADSDVTVTGYEIYRTTGTGSIFYFEGYVDGRTTVTFNVGGTSDTDANVINGRVLQEFGDPPPVGAYFVEMHKQRMWFLRTDAAPRRAYFSDPGLPYSVYTAFNFIDCTDAEAMSDVCTGGTGDFLGQLVIWLERSVWTISGTGDLVGNVRDLVRTRTDAQRGSVSHRTVARIPAGSKYTDSEGNFHTTAQVTLAYMSPLKDIRLFDGNNDTIISFPKQTTLATLNYAQRAKSFCVPDTSRSEVTWIFAVNADNEPSLGVTWNYRHGTWYTRDWPFACGVEIESSASSSILLAGEPNLSIGGLCYELWNGFTRDGQTLTSQWMTKTLYTVGGYGDDLGLFGKPMISIRKRWRYVDLLFDVQGGQVSLQIDAILGDDPPDSAPAFLSRTVSIPLSTLETSDNFIIETSDNSMIEIENTPVTVRSRLIANGKHPCSRGLRLRISAVTSTAQWFLDAIDLAYQVLPGDNRSVGTIP